MGFEKRAIKYIANLAFFFFLILNQNCTGDKGEQYIEIELKRLDETYNLMDAFAKQVWPGWGNYMDVEFRVQFPNLVFLIVNPRDEVPEGYELIPQMTVRNRDVYLNRKEQLPIVIEPPLIGPGGGGLTIRIKLKQGKKADDDWDNKEEDASLFPWVQSEHQILLYVHEFFHGFQSQVWPAMMRQENPVDKRNRKEDIDKEKKKKHRRNGFRPPRFEVNTEYAVYKEIEGRALSGAYEAKDDALALEFLKDSFVAKQLRLSYMPERFAEEEVHTSVSEGTATYSNTKMAMLAGQENYEPAMSQAADPYFFNYKYMDRYIREQTTSSLKQVMEYTLNTLGHCYTYGMIQCFLLDRFVPEWKNGFFENNRTQDDVIKEFLKLDDEEKKRIAGTFATKYGFDDIYAKHAAVLKERDDAIALIESRKGKKYVIDFEKTKEFLHVEPRGKSVRLGVRQIFLNGIKKLTLGDICLMSEDIPMEKPWLWTVDWVDTQSGKNEKGYELKYEKEDDGTYYNVTFSCGGFLLKAPEVKINSEENEVRIIILSKVAR